MVSRKKNGMTPRPVARPVTVAMSRIWITAEQCISVEVMQEQVKGGIAPPAYVGLGGNVGDVRATFGRAVELLRALAGVTCVRESSLWDTEPQGQVREQLPFLNACVEVHFAAGHEPTPAALLAALLEIERALGRDRNAEICGGPRSIDLDLLVWGERLVEETGPPAVRIPHPRLGGRAFALAPLVELAGEDLVIVGPGGGRADALLKQALSSQLVRKILTSSR